MRENGLRPDLVYIDASHEEGAVYRDLSAYWALLRPDGVIVGDDFAKFPSVQRAAARFAAEVGRDLENYGDKFVLRRAADGANADVPFIGARSRGA